jgi:hypothetical protein
MRDASSRQAAILACGWPVARGDGEQEEVELFQGVWHAGQEPSRLPALLGRLPGLAVGTEMMVPDDVGLQGLIELVERELRGCGGSAVPEAARKHGQEELVHG